MTYDKKKYDYAWKQISIRPDTKQLLEYLCIQMGNEYVALPMSTVVDALIREKITHLQK